MSDARFNPPDAYAWLLELATVLGAAPVTEHAACWETTFTGVDGGEWFVALHAQTGKLIACSRGSKVPAFTFYIEWNGWPAGLIDPSGGVIAAGELANESTLIDAVKKQIASVDAAIAAEGVGDE